MSGAPISTSRTQDPAKVLEAWPDSIFPEVMPPFEVNGALLAANGDIWVRRTAPLLRMRIRVCRARRRRASFLEIMVGSRYFFFVSFSSTTSLA